MITIKQFEINMLVTKKFEKFEFYKPFPTYTNYSISFGAIFQKFERTHK